MSGINIDLWERRFSRQAKISVDHTAELQTFRELQCQVYPIFFNWSDWFALLRHEYRWLHNDDPWHSISMGWIKPVAAGIWLDVLSQLSMRRKELQRYVLAYFYVNIFPSSACSSNYTAFCFNTNGQAHNYNPVLYAVSWSNNTTSRYPNF